MKRIATTIGELQAQYQWSRIKHLRSRAELLLAQGTGNTDPRLVTLSNQILTHGIKVSQLRNARRNDAPRPQILLEEESERVTV